MAKVAFVADRSYSSQAALNTQLGSMSITQLILAQFNQPSQWAAAWAQANNVPWLSLAGALDAAGYIGASLKPLGVVLFGNPDTMLTAGTNGFTAAAAASALARGKTVTQI